MRLVQLPADEVGVLVGLEVREAHDHLLRRERRGDHRDALGDALHEVVPRRRVRGDPLGDLVVQRGLEGVEVEQCAGMDADLPVDHELEAREADALVRELRERERLVGGADVEHDLRRALRHLVEPGDDLLERQDALVDEAVVALRARDGHLAAVLERDGRVAGADDGGDAEFPGDDRRVTGAAAAVGDDRGGELHDRLPVRVGHVGDQHVARVELVHLGEGGHHPHRAGADLLPDRPPDRDHRAGLLEHEPARDVAVDAGDDRLGAGLQDVQLAVDAVLAPLDVHRTPVVVLDHQRLPAELLDLGVGDAELRALGERRRR